VIDRLPHTLRSDALDNRERILDAARALFSADGLDVPMREIARCAGVGPATLYRHFPTKQVLATEAFADQLRACRTIVDDGCRSSRGGLAQRSRLSGARCRLRPRRFADRLAAVSGGWQARQGSW